MIGWEIQRKYIVLSCDVQHPTQSIEMHGMHDDYSILSMVEQELGYSLLAELVLQKTAYDVAVRPVDEPILRTMALVMKDKRGLSAAAKTFIRH